MTKGRVKKGPLQRLGLLGIGIALAFGGQKAWADDAEEISALKATVTAQGALIKDQAEAIEELKQDLSAVKGQPAAALTEEEVTSLVTKAIEEKQLDTKKGIFAEGVPSLKGEWWKLGGKLEFEFVDSQADRGETDVTTNAREADGASSFQVDKLVLQPEVFYNDDISFFAELEITGQDDGKENLVNLNQAYLEWRHFLEYFCLPTDPTGTWLRVGDFDYFEKTWASGKRKTENYDLVTNTFYRDDDLGIRVGGNTKVHALLQPFWYAQLSNGNRIDDRSSMDRSGAYESLVYDENNLDFNNHKMWRGGVGNTFAMDKYGQVDVLGWLSTQDLDLADDIGGKIDDVEGFEDMFVDPDGANPELEANIAGLIGSYKLGGFQFVAQFAKGPVSNLDIDTYEFRPSYKFTLPGIERAGRKFFTGLELLYSYSRYQLKNLPAVATDARTWDREKHIMAALFDVTKNVKLKTEYAVHDENTGGDDVANNEFLAQLEIAW